MISISGLFAVTFSVVFAYVADVTDETNRTTAYGLVKLSCSNLWLINVTYFFKILISFRSLPHSQLA